MIQMKVFLILFIVVAILIQHIIDITPNVADIINGVSRKGSPQ